MTARSTPDPTRTAPTLADYARSLWRRRILVGLGLLAGLALGFTVLPKVGPQFTYRATIRVDVRPLTSTVLSPSGAAGQPGLAPTKPATTPESPLRDVRVAGAVLRQLGRDAPRLAAVADQPKVRWAGALADAIVATPVPGSTQVDLSYVDGDQARAARVVQAYAGELVRRRNTADAALTAAGLQQLQRRADSLKAQIAGLAQQADREANPYLHRPASTATSTELRLATDHWRSQTAVIDGIRRQLLFLGQPTAVLGPAVVMVAGQPLSAPVYVALSLLLGLLAGAGLALVTEAVRPKVLTLRDVERATGVEPIEAVPAAGVTRRKPIAVVQRPFSPAAEGFRKLAAKLEARGLGRDLRVLVVTSTDRREGKSTLVANLADALSHKGRHVVVVSGDLRHPDVERIFRLEPHRPGLAELLQGDDTDPVARLVSVRCNLLVLPAGVTSRNPAELLFVARLRELIWSLREIGWTVLIDTPPAGSLADAVTLAGAADAVLLVARAGVSRWRRLRELAGGFRRAGLPIVGAALVGSGNPVSSRYELRRSAYVGHVGAVFPSRAGLPSPDRRPVKRRPVESEVLHASSQSQADEPA